MLMIYEILNLFVIASNGVAIIVATTAKVTNALICTAAIKNNQSI